jgi:hypothetical protein
MATSTSAAVYDDYKSDPTRSEFADEDVESTVAFLARLARPGRALEFGVGTGRIALPLAQRDVPTVGIDLSRWEGWNQEPFTSESRKHVSVWEKAGSPARSCRSSGRDSGMPAHGVATRIDPRPSWADACRSAPFSR